MPDLWLQRSIATSRISVGGSAETKHPRRQFSVKVGTIFEDSPAWPGQVVHGRVADR